MVVEEYKKTERSHAFCVKTEQVGGPLLRICDARTDIFAEPFKRKDSVHSFYVIAAFYSSQAPKPVERKR